MKSDRRAKPRFKPLRLGHFICDHTTAIAGWISDISFSGVAFDYHPQNGMQLPTHPFIDIADSEDGDPIIQGVRCRTVYDVPILSENRSFKRGIEVRRCGLEFDNPNLQAQAKLVDLLADYCMEI